LTFSKNFGIIYIEKEKEDKYMSIEEKLALVTTEYQTASKIGLPAATLGALVRRGMVEVLDTIPKQYRKASGSATNIYVNRTE